MKSFALYDIIVRKHDPAKNAFFVRNNRLPGRIREERVIRSVVPEAGTCDMAQWHILIEPEKGIHVESEADVALSVNGTDMCNLP